MRCECMRSAHRSEPTLEPAKKSSFGPAAGTCTSPSYYKDREKFKSMQCSLEEDGSLTKLAEVSTAYREARQNCDLRRPQQRYSTLRRVKLNSTDGAVARTMYTGRYTSVDRIVGCGLMMQTTRIAKVCLCDY